MWKVINTATNAPKATTIAPIPVAVKAAANVLAPVAAAASPTPTATNDLAKAAFNTVYTLVIPVSLPIVVIAPDRSLPNSAIDDLKSLNDNCENDFNLSKAPPV